MVAPVYQVSEVMGVLNITRIHPKGGKKQEIVAPAHQGYVGLTSWEMRFLIISRIPLKRG